MIIFARLLLASFPNSMFNGLRIENAGVLRRNDIETHEYVEISANIQNFNRNYIKMRYVC